MLLVCAPAASATTGMTLVWSSVETDATQDVAWGDFDSDGDLDFAAANKNQASRVYRNTGGAFSAAWSSSQTNNTSSVKWGDCDGDGDLDIAAGNEGQANYVYRNAGGGSFSTAWVSSALDTTYGQSWGDYDADGDLDIVEANFSGNKVYRNNGNCGFSLKWTGPVAITYEVQWADFDRDGLPDIAAGRSDATEVFMNGGSGSFSSVWSSTQVNTNMDLTVTDYNADGLMDIFSVNSSFSDGQPNRLYRNNANDTFTLVWTESASGSTYTPSYGATWGDWDGDGDQDFAIANTGVSPTANYVYINTGAGFSFSWATPENDGSLSAAFGDYDGDGDLDLLFGNYSLANRIYRNDLSTANAQPGIPVPTPVSDGPTGACLLSWSPPADDITPDDLLTYQVRLGLCSGCEDALSGAFAPPYGNAMQGASAAITITVPGTYFWSVRAIDNTGFAPGNWSAEDSFVVTAAFSTAWSSAETAQTASIAVGDYDGDGDQDVYEANNGANYLYENNDANNNFTTIWTTAETDNSSSAAFGDYDGDGDLDILTGNYAQQNRVYRNNANDSFTLLWSSVETDNTLDVAWGDCDNDGDLDQLAVADGQNRVYTNDGGGAFTSVWTSTESELTTSLAAADFDKDGKLDFAVANNGSPNRVYKGGGDCSFSSVWSSPQTGDSRSVSWADMDSDGDIDLIAANNGSANRVYSNDGGNSFSALWSAAGSDASARLVPGDYDSDGDYDLLSLNNSTGGKTLRNDNGSSFTMVWTSTETDNSRAGEWADFDGDGDLDIFAGNDGTPGRLYINNITATNAAPSQPTVIAASDILSSSFPVRADFVWSPSEDDITPADVITYQLRVGTCAGCDDVVSSHIPEYGGNMGATGSAFLNLAAGTYFWSVAAVDASGFYRGTWSAEDSFAIKSTKPFRAMWESGTTDDTYDSKWGDFDGDGDLDILTAGTNGGRVYRNDTGGNFTSVWTETLEAAGSASVGDWDNDGDLDLAIEDRFFRNDGGNSFSSAWSAAESNDTMDSVFTDYDSDGDLDLALANRQGSTPSRVYRNDGAGSFSRGWEYPSAYSDGTYSVDAADYNDDGQPDLLFGNNPQPERIFKNIGGGMFSIGWTSSASLQTHSAKWIDYDGDGGLEIAVAPNAGSIRIYNGVSSTSFSQVWASTETSSFSDIALGDYDADGDIDILAGALNSSDYDALYKNDGSASFSLEWTSEYQSMTYSAEFGDADGDGDLDALMGSRSYFGSYFPTRVLVNNIDPANAAPAAPSPNDIIDQHYGTVRLRWTAPADDHTPAGLFSYAVKVGTCPGCQDIMSGAISPPGNTGASTSVYVNFDSTGQYFWSVAAIDRTGYNASSWSAEDSFNLTTPPMEITWRSQELENTNDIAWGDLDSDGDLDFVASNYQGAKRVYSNSGAASFSIVWSSGDSYMSNAAAVGDSDGDGDLDFFISNTSVASVLYTNSGSNNYATAWSTPATDNTKSAAWGDFDNDGDLDLVAGVYNNKNKVYKNNGGNSFSLSWSSVETYPTNSVAVADMNADGWVDIVSGDGSNGPRVYENNGDGTFSNSWSSTDSNSVNDVAIGDYNADGRPDFFVTNAFNQSRMYGNAGSLSFSAIWSTPATEYSQDATLGDMDGDGDLDILLCNDLNRNRMYQNAGGGSFPLYWSTPYTTYSAKAVAFGDYDGDGDLDHIIGNMGQPKILYRNNAAAANSAPSTPSINALADGEIGNVVFAWSPSTDSITPQNVLTYNLRVGTCAGCDDVMSGAFAPPYGNAGATTTYTLSLNNTINYYWSVSAVDGSGYTNSSWAAEDSFKLSAPVFRDTWNDGTTTDTRDAAWGDYDADGDLDFVVANFGAANVLYKNNGSNTFAAIWTAPSADNSRGATWGDYDNDGDLDLVVANNGADKIYKNTAGVFSLAWTSAETTNSASALLTDTNNDGDLDLIISGTDNSYLYVSSGGGNLGTAKSIGFSGMANVAPGDFNADGQPDLFISTYTAYSDKIYTGNSSSAFASYWTSSQTDNTMGAAIADFDGDGDLDAATANYSGANRLYRNDGAGVFTNSWSTAQTDDTRDAAWGDYDGDGDNDIIIVNGTGAAGRVYRNDASSSFSTLWSFPAAYDSYAIATGDCDGDGDLDVIQANSGSANRVYINVASAANTAPAAPALTAPADVSLVMATASIQLVWTPPSDDHTPSGMLKYNLRVGTCPGCNDVVSGIYAPTESNSGLATSRALILSSAGAYYWSVRTVDNTGFALSTEATEDSFVVGAQPDMLSSYWTSAETDRSEAVAWGDYDGDGDLDYLTGNYGAPTRTYRNIGTGFIASWASGESDNTMDAAWCDLNSDGKPDIVTAVDGAGNRAYRNNGDESFIAFWLSAETDGTKSVACGDYDNDGDLDIIAGNSGASSGQQNRLYSNNGGGSFNTAWSSTESERTTAVLFFDANSDGNLDIFAANTGGSDSLRVYYGNGAGSFASYSLSSAVYASGAAAADLDGDGRQDLIVGTNAGSRQLGVYKNNGGTSFSSVWTSELVYLSSHVSSADFDGDGDNDIYTGNGVAGGSSFSNYIYKNNGGNKFSLSWGSPEVENTLSSAWGDMDDDGDLDLIAGNSGANRVYRNVSTVVNAAPSAPTSQASTGGELSGAALPVRLTWTPATDAISPATTLGYRIKLGSCPNCEDVISSSAVYPWANAFATSSALINISNPGTYYWSVVAVDNTGFMGDAWSSEQSFTVTNPSSLPFGKSWTSSRIDDTTRIAWGDANGDGRLDLLTANDGPSNFNVLYTNQGNGNFSVGWTSSDNVSTRDIVWGDYDNDGDLDFAAANYGQANRVFANNGSGQFSSVWATSETDDSSGIDFGDYNLDGLLDILVSNESQKNRVYKNKGSGMFELVWSSSELDATKDAAWCDLDNDGDLDHVAANNGQPNAFYKNTGNNLFVRAWTTTESDASMAVVCADYDGDTDQDVIFANGSGQSNKLYHTYSSFMFTMMWQSGEAENSTGASAGDYDGDGDMDLLFTNNQQPARLYDNTGTGYFTLAWSSVETAAASSSAWGDYDNDGDIDIAVGIRGGSNYLYRNNKNPGNTAPAAPAIKAVSDMFLTATSSVAVTFSWSPPADDNTAPGLLTYQLRVGTSQGGGDIMTEAFAPPYGNALSKTTKAINISNTGTYYWSVAAVDTTGLTPGDWSIEDDFKISDPTQSTSISKGWTLISFPSITNGATVKTMLLDTPSIMESFEYSGGALTNGAQAIASAGKGYWVYSSSAATLNPAGAIKDPASTLIINPITRGWNVVGNPYADYLKWDDNINLNCGDATLPVSTVIALDHIGAQVFTYENGVYTPLTRGDSIPPWRAFFIKVKSVSCSITLKR